jgi:hypothetical protein
MRAGKKKMISASSGQIKEKIKWNAKITNLLHGSVSR